MDVTTTVVDFATYAWTIRTNTGRQITLFARGEDHARLRFKDEYQRKADEGPSSVKKVV